MCRHGSEAGAAVDSVQSVVEVEGRRRPGGKGNQGHFSLKPT